MNLDELNRRQRQHRWPTWVAVTLAVVLGASGCTLIPRRPRAPQANAPSVLSADSRRAGAPTAAELQAKVMSFADGFIHALAETCADLELQLTDPRERAALQSLKLNFANTALLIASGANPSANLVDMVAENERLRTLLADVQESLEAGRDMATAVERAAQALDTFAGRFERPPTTNGLATEPQGRPFDVRDYATAATEISRGAQDLTRQVESLDRLLASSGWQQPGEGGDGRPRPRASVFGARS